MVQQNKPQSEKTNLWGFQPSLTQTGLFNHRRWLVVWNFGFSNYMYCNCNICEVKTKALISSWSATLFTHMRKQVLSWRSSFVCLFCFTLLITGELLKCYWYHIIQQEMECELDYSDQVAFEPRCEKTGLRGFRPGPTQIRLYSNRIWLEAWNFGFRK